MIGFLDLTSLGHEDTAEDVAALCARAVTPLGPVAAVCINPEHVAVAVAALDGAPVRVATVANFPAGADDAEGAAAQTAAAIEAGADEVDVVVPWRAHLAGDHAAVGRLVAACADVTGPGRLKAILETGSHPDAGATRAIAQAAQDAGAAFLKTSTGKVGTGASVDAARILAEVVRDAGAGGIKVSGGVRTREDAARYVAVVEEVLGAPLTAETFRIGASSLLDDLLRSP